MSVTRKQEVLLPVIPVTLSDNKRVPIRVSHNGKPYRYHQVSVGFLRRLNAFLLAHPKLDTVWDFV